MKFEQVDEFSVAERNSKEYASVSRIAASVVMRTVVPCHAGFWFETNDELDVAIKLGRALVAAATEAKRRRGDA